MTVARFVGKRCSLRHSYYGYLQLGTHLCPRGYSHAGVLAGDTSPRPSGVVSPSGKVAPDIVHIRGDLACDRVRR